MAAANIEDLAAAESEDEAAEAKDLTAPDPDAPVTADTEALEAANPEAPATADTKGLAAAGEEFLAEAEVAAPTRGKMPD